LSRLSPASEDEDLVFATLMEASLGGDPVQMSALIGNLQGVKCMSIIKLNAIILYSISVILATMACYPAIERRRHTAAWNLL
jgi:hypothetical protein